jgi:hypothetical protein
MSQKRPSAQLLFGVHDAPAARPGWQVLAVQKSGHSHWAEPEQAPPLPTSGTHVEFESQ